MNSKSRLGLNMESLKKHHGMIAFIIYDYSQISGRNRVASNLANALSAESNVLILSIFNSEHQLSFPLEEDIKYVVLKDGPGHYRSDLIYLIRRLKQLTRKHSIAALIAAGIAAIPTACCLAQITGAPLISWEQTSFYNTVYATLRYRLFRRFALWISRFYVVLTEDSRQGLINAYPRARDRIVTIANWYDEEIVSGRLYNLNSKRIISVGRADPVKGYDMMIQVAKIIRSELPDWKWDIWGDFSNTYGNEIMQTVRREGVDDFIVFRGTTNSIEAILNDYAIFVLTSYHEGFPMVLLEARANRLPMVSFNCRSGPDQIIDDGINGILTEPENIQQLSAAIITLAKDDNRRKRYSDQCLDGLNKYHKDHIIRQWNKILEGGGS